jgi:transcriptional regulator with XRE-family HTH domain
MTTHAPADDPISTLLWRARVNAGLSISEAADAAGLRYMAVWWAEHGRPPSLALLDKLAAAYGCAVVVALVKKEAT